MAHEQFKEKRRANPVLKDGVCACPRDQKKRSMKMNQMMSEKLEDLATALALFHRRIETITTNKTVSYSGRKFSYADLSAIWGVIRKPLGECGLSVIQMIDGSNLNTTLLHNSGQYISNSVSLGISPNVDHKQLGAAITYMRRYALVSMLSLVADEDEGEAPEVKVPLNIPHQDVKQIETPKSVNLSEQQVAEIEGLIGEDIAFLNKILQLNKKLSLKDIPSNQYKFIMEALKNR